MNIRNKPAFIVENLLHFSGVLKISQENPKRKKKKEEISRHKIMGKLYFEKFIKKLS